MPFFDSILNYLGGKDTQDGDMPKDGNQSGNLKQEKENFTDIAENLNKNPVIVEKLDNSKFNIGKENKLNLNNTEETIVQDTSKLELFTEKMTVQNLKTLSENQLTPADDYKDGINENCNNNDEKLKVCNADGSVAKDVSVACSVEDSDMVMLKDNGDAICNGPESEIISHNNNDVLESKTHADVRANEEDLNASESLNKSSSKSSKNECDDNSRKLCLTTNNDASDDAADIDMAEINEICNEKAVDCDSKGECSNTGSTEQNMEDSCDGLSCAATSSNSDSRSTLCDVDEGSNLSSSSTQNIVTQTMIEQEQKYEKEHEKKDKEDKDKAVQEIQAAPEDQRFNRLKNLLDKSNVYAQFLLKRMDQQREEDKKKRETKEKALEKRAQANLKKKEANNSPAASSQESSAEMNETGGMNQSLRNSPLKARQERKGKRKREDNDSTPKSPNKAKRGRSKRQKMESGKVPGEDGDDDQVVPEVDTTTEGTNNERNMVKTESDISDKDSLHRIIKGEIVSDRQPMLVTGGVLRSYQLDGMEWLRGLFENGINGILADEMGLGKTLQCISLLAYLLERGIKGPFLIAAPLSTLPNWVSEFKKFCPKVSAILYHGTKEERAKMRGKISQLKMIDAKTSLRSFPVVITSYEIIMRDRAELCNYNWKYIIIDEGHRIKNLNCRLIRELKTYKTANRLLLTGTPLQNNLAELWSLLNFLLPDIFDDLYSFQQWFDFSAVAEDDGHEKIIAQEQEAHVLETLHAILTPFLLRRLKTDVDLSIPPKRELLVFAPLTKQQEEYYKSTLDKTILEKIQKKSRPVMEIEYSKTGRPKRRSTKEVNYKTIYDIEDDELDIDSLLEKVQAEDERKANSKEDSTKKNSTNSVVSIKMQNILMQLRKCCNHPYLLEYPLDPTTKDYLINEDIVKVSGKMLLLDRMLAELKRRGHKVLIFSQMTAMLDIIQDFCCLRHYQFSRIDGAMKIPERQEMIEQFNSDPDVFIFLLSTRAGGLGINLSSADTCIIYDSDWNPQVDLQAQDRCHRIGQTKPVLIFRYVTANTVDETVVERASAKRKLEKMVIHKGKFKGKHVSQKLSPQDLLDLLKSNDHRQFSGLKNDFFISDECLNQLLDRSALNENKELKDQETNENLNSEIFKVVQNKEEKNLF